MIAKEKFTKIMYIVLALCVIVLFLLIFDTSCTALKTNDINYEDYINKTFATQNTDTTLKFVGNEKLEISNERKRTIYVVVEVTKSAVKVSDSQQDFYIKFIDENTIFCEKTQRYMYLSEHKERLLW